MGCVDRLLAAVGRAIALGAAADCHGGEGRNGEGVGF